MLTHTAIRSLFGDKALEKAPLAAYTSARIGGPADVLVIAQSIDELARTVQICWARSLPFTLLGSGSNLLISDKGIRGVVVLNRAKNVEFREGRKPSVRAEAGAAFANLAHRAANRGLSGLEWAANVPGTVGGAVYGNAGAFGGDVAHDLIQAEMVTIAGRETWSVEKLAYGYRTSALKRGELKGIVLAAEFKLKTATPQDVQAKIDEYTEKRKTSQPPGASMGSMFKNPPNDYAGRLIEAAGLKGTRIGNAEISQLHANFFVNHGEASATDIYALIQLARKTVKEKFDVDLELEVELLGEW